jgi:hypothetical protein
MPDTVGLMLSGRVRIELPQYRIRGLCRMVYSPGGMLRIDFHHSSLFGALQEDATLMVRDSLIIFDRESGRLFDADSSLAMLRESVGAPIEPDDIIYALILAAPLCWDLEHPRCEIAGDEWNLEAVWRGRRVEWTGERSTGIRTFRQCFSGAAGCYVTYYGYGGAVGNINYPKRIRLAREGGDESITMDVRDVEWVALDRSVFESIDYTIQ